MRTIEEIYGDYFAAINSDAEIGVEVEVESNTRLSSCTGWRLVGDGSLRGDYSGEYVFQGPVDESTAIERVKDLQKVFLKSEVYETYRAGVHLHVNVRDLTPKQLMVFIAFCYVFEEALVDWCGTTRSGNHFCLRMVDAEGPLEYVCQWYKNNYKMDYLDTDAIRYAATNLNPIVKYGSIELRSLPTTVTLDNIIPWMQVYLHIKKKSLEYENPAFIMENFSGAGAEAFAKEFLEEHFDMIKGQNELEQKLWRGMRFAQDLFLFSGV